MQLCRRFVFEYCHPGTESIGGYPAFELSSHPGAVTGELEDLGLMACLSQPNQRSRSGVTVYLGVKRRTRLRQAGLRQRELATDEYRATGKEVDLTGHNVPFRWLRLHYGKVTAMFQAARPQSGVRMVSPAVSLKSG
ncbi:MAG: hypothetical protein JSW71_16970 [Gemmatimonadota bacterium]|nr:MAG: hypothetical protein JSW71_16970 [Gemmatimonadota bacterium]